MANSSVLISLSSNPTNAETFTITSNKFSNIVVTFKTATSNSGDVLIDFNTELTTTNLLNVLENDFNSLNDFTLTRVSVSSIKLESNYENTTLNKDDVGLSSGSLTVTNIEYANPISIENQSFPFDSSGDCNNQSVKIDANMNITEYSVDGGLKQTPTVINDYVYISLPRESEVEVTVYNNEQISEVSDSITFKTPLKLQTIIDSYTSYKIQWFPQGSTLTIYHDAETPYPYSEYSIQYTMDVGVTWQVNNVFTGLSDGLQPSLGFREESEGDGICTYDDAVDDIFIEEQISPFATKTPYFEIPKSVSLNMVYNEQVNHKNIYKNNFNTLSCDSDNQISEHIEHLYQSSDIVPFQFRSNYNTQNAFVKSNDGSIKNLDINLVVQNIGLTDGYDCHLTDLGDGKTGVYFSSGNKYRFLTETVYDTFTLDGYLPEFAKKGNYVFVKEYGGWFEISNIIYSEELDADVIVFENIFSDGDNTDTIIYSEYNSHNYNVYTLNVLMVDLKEKTSNLVIDVSDEREDWKDLCYSSENIYVEDKQENTFELIYFNYNNTSDMYYKGLGFYNLMRLEYELISGLNENEIKILKTDNTTITESTRNYNGKKIILKTLPLQYLEKITNAFSNKEIFIDRIQYTVKSIEQGEVIGNTNTYPLEIELINAEERYNPLQDRNFVGNVEIIQTKDDRYALVDENGNYIEDGNDNIIIG